VKRFGVSLPQELAEAIDKISQETGATRSEVVAAALQEYLEMQKDHKKPGHQCLGVVMAVTDAFSDVGDAIEENRAHIVAYTHLHVEGMCLTIVVVKGGGEEIEKLTLGDVQKGRSSRVTCRFCEDTCKAPRRGETEVFPRRRVPRPPLRQGRNCFNLELAPQRAEQPHSLSA
jgi:CopG family nickel-responsive transcriptional regulator